MSEWQPIETAPRDGSQFTVLYDDESTEDAVYWSDERFCILGAPMGSFGPGLVSTEAGHLPIGTDGNIVGWRPWAIPIDHELDGDPSGSALEGQNDECH